MVCDGRLFIFGGIFELTKELNDLCLFEIEKQAFHPTKSLEAAGPSNAGGESPMKVEHQDTANKSGLQHSMTRQRTTIQNASPSKRKPSPKKKIEVPGETHTEARAQLTSPTSITMQNSFIVKNADESFDAYYHTMRKRRTMNAANAGMEGGSMKKTCTGFVKGNKPNPRDGHTATLDSKGNMFVFGGDRHQMPFNDLFMIRLARD